MTFLPSLETTPALKATTVHVSPPQAAGPEQWILFCLRGEKPIGHGLVHVPTHSQVTWPREAGAALCKKCRCPAYGRDHQGPGFYRIEGWSRALVSTNLALLL